MLLVIRNQICIAAIIIRYGSEKVQNRKLQTSRSDRPGSDRWMFAI